MGIDESRVRALYPPEEVSDKFYFPQPAKNDAEIEVALQHLSQNISEKLFSRDAQTRKIALNVVFETHEQAVERTFNRPMRSAGALLTGIRLTLRQVEVRQDVCALLVNVVHEPASDAQFAIETEKEHSDTCPAVQRLKETFGANAIIAAKEVVIPRRRLLLRAFEGE